MPGRGRGQWVSAFRAPCVKGTSSRQPAQHVVYRLSMSSTALWEVLGL